MATTDATVHLTILLGNAHSRGENVEVVESRKPGLYGIGGPGPGGLITIARLPERGMTARIDVRADQTFEVYPTGVNRTEFAAQRDFWTEILS